MMWVSGLLIDAMGLTTCAAFFIRRIKGTSKNSRKPCWLRCKTAHFAHLHMCDLLSPIHGFAK